MSDDTKKIVNYIMNHTDTQSAFNWEHDVNQTPYADLIENVRMRVSTYTGENNLRIQITDGILEIESLRTPELSDSTPNCLLKARLYKNSFVEIYGRFKNVGLNPYEVLYMFS